MSEFSDLFEALSPKHLARRMASRAQRQQLRAYFGDEEADELMDLSELVSAKSDTIKTKETVFILPGFMGSKLSDVNRFRLDGLDLIWLEPFSIAKGDLQKLKWNPGDNQIEPSGAFHLTYLKMKLSLQLHDINARYLPYDWRKTPAMNAEILMPMLRSEGNVSLVCHSQGGRVARMLMNLDKDRKVIRRVITMGTPHYGLYAPVQALAVNLPLLNTLAKIDKTQSRHQIIRDIVRDMPGLLEMMPLPAARPGEEFFNLGWWPKQSEPPAQVDLTNAEQAAQNLPEMDDRAAIIVGTGRTTTSGSRVAGNKLEFVTDDKGDGTVAFDLANVEGVPTWYTGARHAFIANDKDVIKAVVDLLDSNNTLALPTDPTQVVPTGIKQLVKRKRRSLIGEVFESMHES